MGNVLRCVIVVLSLSIVAASTGVLAAQARRGRLLVTVADATGAVIPNAEVRVTGIEAATRALAVAPGSTGERGVATFDGLVPGRYSVTAAFAGFDAGVLKSVSVRIGDNRQTVTLTVKAVTDAVTVGRDPQEAAADREVSFGTVMTREQIDALSDDPAELRQQLIDMAGPDAVIAVDSFEGAQLPPKSQIRSIRVARDQFAAENHAAGIGRIEIITQPGIGPFRGNVGTSFFDSAFDGRHPLVPQSGPAQNRSFFASLGGTVIPEKLSVSAFTNGSTGYNTPVVRSATSTGVIARNADLRAPNDNLYSFAQADYALTADQTLRVQFNRFRTRSRNQGVGTYDEIERAYSTTRVDESVYVQQNGPVGRRFVLNTRLSMSWSDARSTSVLDAPTIVVTDARTTGGAQRTGGTRSRSVWLGSDLDYVRGIHSLRVGMVAEHFRYVSDANTNYLGTYTFESPAAFDSGRPRSFTRRIGDPLVRYDTMQLGLYVQDDIRVRRNLTLSPGLRYEAQSQVPGRWNFGPRFGVTWAPFAGGRTTFRTSVGVFYDWLNNGTYQQTLQVDGFRQREINLVDPDYPDPGPVGAASPVNRYVLAGDMRLPRTVRVSLGVAHTFSQRLSVGAVYADSRATGLLVGANLNAPVDGQRPDGRFANVIEARSDGRSRQRVLTSTLQMNLGGQPTAGALFAWKRGLRLNVTHGLGVHRNNTDGAFSTPATGDLGVDWGYAQTDVRHRLNVGIGSAFLRSLTVGLQVNMTSAPPLTIRTGLDDNGDLIFNDRPMGLGRNTERTRGQRTASVQVGYQMALGRRSVTSLGGVSITSQGGGLVVNQGTMQAMPRYRLFLGVSIQNLTNRPNYSGYSGVMTSPLFLQPSSAQGVRRVTFNASVSF